MRITRTLALLAVPISLLLPGCFYGVREHDPDKKKHYTEEYSHTDQKKAVAQFVDSILKTKALNGQGESPILIVYGINNRTSEHIDTTGFTDKLEIALLKTGRAQFVNKAQRTNIEKEVGYMNSGKVDAATRIKLGKQLGAKYMLTGTFHSIDRKEPKEIRLRRGRLLYYQLVLELTNIESSLIEWKDEVEVLKEGRRPIIGW